MNQQQRIDFLLKKTGDLQKQGMDCLHPKCDNCTYECTCPRYKCLSCKIVARNEFCKAMSQLLLEDL